MILDCDVDFEGPIIPGRPFLGTGRVLAYIDKRLMIFWLNNDEATLNICRSNEAD